MSQTKHAAAIIAAMPLLPIAIAGRVIGFAVGLCARSFSAGYDAAEEFLWFVAFGRPKR